MGNVLYPVLMLIAGIGIPVMAALNAGLGVRLQSPSAAVFILCVVALVLAAIGLAITATPSQAAIKATPIQYYLAGTLFIFYIATITIAAPRIGVGNAVFFVLLGQLISAALLDHYGLWGMPVAQITPKRILGILLMTVGIYLARKEVVPSLPNL